METKLTTLEPFFINPNEKYSIRELSRIIGVNHTSVRQHLNKLVKEDFLSLKKEGIYSFYRLILNKKTLNLKLYYNLEKIRESKIIETIEQDFDYPVVVLFGSYADAMDDQNSDVDLCIISNIKKEPNLKKFEKKLDRKISIHKFNKATWEKARKSNQNLVNNICNGITLSGELEVL